MKVKKRSWVIALSITALLILTAIAVVLMLNPSSSGSTYNRRVEENLFSLDMDPLNCKLEETFYINEGDTVDVGITVSSGEIFILVGEAGENPVYEGNNPTITSFRLNISKAGEYVFAISGVGAVGNVTFQINRAAD